MEINYFSPSFLVPAVLTIAMLCIPITVITDGRLSLFKTLLISIFVYTLIIFIGFPPA